MPLRQVARGDHHRREHAFERVHHGECARAGALRRGLPGGFQRADDRARGAARRQPQRRALGGSARGDAARHLCRDRRVRGVGRAPDPQDQHGGVGQGPCAPGRGRRSGRAHRARAQAHCAGGAAGHRVPVRRPVGRGGHRASQRHGGDEEPALAAHLLLLARAAEPGAQGLARAKRQRGRGAEGLLPPRPHERPRRAGPVAAGARKTSCLMALYESRIKSLPRIGQGKVRDIYAVGADKMLIVASDRLSAFDVVLSDPIPDKGRVLNEMANFWFERLGHIVPNQLTGIDPESVVAEEEKPQVRGRSVVVQKLKPLPIEAVVRGYIIGSGWKDYQKTGKICGIELPKGLQQAQKLPQPIFTPATKAQSGHDENISFAEVEQLIGGELATKVREVSIRLYQEAADYAATKGIIIADTKFEFGLNANNDLVLIDEVLTADSSRFWPADSYRVGISPPSYDKQYVRDYLESLTWDKTPPAPKLPEDVIARTSQKYRDALERLTGRELS